MSDEAQEAAAENSIFSKFRQATRNLGVATTLNFTQQSLKKISNMVYLYDPTWTATDSPEDAETLPFALIQVIKEEVLQQNNVSKRRIILFEPEVEETTEESFRPSVVHVVADNVVVDPLRYKLECLVPSNAINTLVGESLQFGMTATSLGGAGSVNAAIQHVAEIFDITKSVTKIVKTLFNSANDYNRKSIISMSRRRSILKYKAWNSWQIRNVVITGVTMTKVGTEDDYFRCSLELQEMPILYVGAFKARTKLQTLGHPEAKIYNSIKSLFEKMTASTDRRLL